MYRSKVTPVRVQHPPLKEKDWPTSTVIHVFICCICLNGASSLTKWTVFLYFPHKYQAWSNYSIVFFKSLHPILAFKPKYPLLIMTWYIFKNSSFPIILIMVIIIKLLAKYPVPWLSEPSSHQWATRQIPPISSQFLSSPPFPLSFDWSRRKEGGGGTDTCRSSRQGDIHEDFCTVCRRSGQLLMCDTCSRVYHLDCLDPPLKIIPKGMWICPKCQDQVNNSSTTSPWPLLYQDSQWCLLLTGIQSFKAHTLLYH